MRRHRANTLIDVTADAQNKPQACIPVRAGQSSGTNAFTLMEVMVACGIFFMATFAILALVSTTLRNARG